MADKLEGREAEIAWLRAERLAKEADEGHNTVKPSTIFYGVLTIATIWTVIGGIVFGLVALATYRNPRHDTGVIIYGLVFIVGPVVLLSLIFSH